MSFHWHLNNHFLSRWCISQLQHFLLSASQKLSYGPKLLPRHVQGSTWYSISSYSWPLAFWFISGLADSNSFVTFNPRNGSCSFTVWDGGGKACNCRSSLISTWLKEDRPLVANGLASKIKALHTIK